MCIRDSFNGKLAEHRVPQAVDNRSSNLVFSAATVDQYPTCLLYTSDAADERSSVDLGGRRIIKKKKSVWEKSENAEKHTEAGREARDATSEVDGWQRKVEKRERT